MFLIQIYNKISIAGNKDKWEERMAKREHVFNSECYIFNFTIGKDTKTCRKGEGPIFSWIWCFCPFLRMESTCPSLDVLMVLQDPFNWLQQERRGIRTWHCPSLLLSLHPFLCTICLLHSFSPCLLTLRFAYVFLELQLEYHLYIFRAFSFHFFVFWIATKWIISQLKATFFCLLAFMFYLWQWILGCMLAYSLSGVSGRAYRKNGNICCLLSHINLHYLIHHEERCQLSYFWINRCKS